MAGMGKVIQSHKAYERSIGSLGLCLKQDAVLKVYGIEVIR
jgi:anthranilate/para-aminobenzoate synthase component II